MHDCSREKYLSFHNAETKRIRPLRMDIRFTIVEDTMPVSLIDLKTVCASQGMFQLGLLTCIFGSSY